MTDHLHTPDHPPVSAGLPDWAMREVNSLKAIVREQRAQEAVYAEFKGNAHLMAAAILRLRRG